MLTPERFDAILSDATRLSRSLGDDPLSRFLDLLYDYPAALFHRSAARALSELEGPRRLQQVTRDFRNTFPLLLRSGFGTRNLGRRLRAFRLRHDLTLVETADLLDISKSQLHRIESGQRSPSPRTRFRLLRLLSLPVPDASSCHPERSEGSAFGSSPDTDHGTPVTFLKALLSQPPPHPPEFAHDPDGLHRLRFLWLTSYTSTKSLAAQLGISQPHLIRLLRGDRRPSRSVEKRIRNLLP